MSARAATWLAWLLWAPTAGCALSLLVLHEKGSLIVILPVAAWVVTSSTVGALIVSRRPENPIGWILCVSGFLFAFSIFSGTYAAYALVVEPGSLPAPREISWLLAVGGPLALAFAPFLFLLFPTGRLPSRRWRTVAWIAGTSGAVIVALNLFFARPDKVGGRSPRRPSPWYSRSSPLSSSRRSRWSPAIDERAGWSVSS